MNSTAYFLNQAWLAHKELGLGPLVTVELWILAIMLPIWVAERIVRRAKRIARAREQARIDAATGMTG